MCVVSLSHALSVKEKNEEVSTPAAGIISTPRSGPGTDHEVGIGGNRPGLTTPVPTGDEGPGPALSIFETPSFKNNRASGLFPGSTGVTSINSYGGMSSLSSITVNGA